MSNFLCAYTDMHRGHRWGTPVKSKWMVLAKRQSVFPHQHPIVQSGDVKNFFFLTQARTGRHIVEACPQPSPNSLTRLSPPATVLASEQRHLFCSDRVFMFNANRIAIRVQTKY